MRTLIKVKFGSHLYGTSTPESDLDFKSVFVPSGRDILLGRYPKTSINESTKKDNDVKNTSSDVDSEDFSLNGFIRLLSEGQTAALEILFAPDDMIVEMDREWALFRDNAHRLVHKDVTAFFGYARQQAAKYGLKGSRISAIRRVMEYLDQFSEDTKLQVLYDAESVVPRDKGLRSFVEKNSDLKLDESEPLIKFTTNNYVRNGQQCEETYFEVCNRKIPLHNNVKHTKQVFQRVWDEYGKRARQAETNEGVDWKALSHAVRVGKQALELLTTGRITLPRPEAATLLAIKKGELPYKEVASLIESLLEELKIVQKESTLPAKFDSALGEDLLLHFYEMAVLDAGEADQLANMRNVYP